MGQPEIGWKDWKSVSSFEASRFFPTTLENRGERFIFLSDRTHNRSRSPRLTASSD